MAMRFPEKFLLKEFHSFYEKLSKKAVNSFKKGDYPQALELISATARYAWQNHPGVFSESKFDEIILKIGEDLDSLVQNAPQIVFQPPPKREDQKRILHVATEIYDLGGHSRLITSWLRNDPDNQHSLIITAQNEQISPKIVEQVLAGGGDFAILPIEKTLLERALILRRAAQDFDLVVIHHHPSDVIPLVAFATREAPPVAIMNHADHLFWLGASVADLVMDIRTFGAEITKRRRKARRSLILPIPLTVNKPKITREEARKLLNIDNDKVVLLSIGAEYKYLRNKVQDFSSTAKKILESNPQAVFYLIGAKYDEEKFASHERLHYLGSVLDPTLYQLAADIYLEGFPVSSFTALLETVVFGVCPVLMYSPNQIVSFEREMALQDCEKNAQNESEYIERVSRLINNPEYRTRLGKTVAEKVLDYHCGATWREYLRQIYIFLENRNHQPELIEETNFTAENEDLFLVEIKNNQLQFLSSPLWLEWILANPQIYKSLSKLEFVQILHKFWKIKDIKFLLDKVKWQHVTRFLRALTEKRNSTRERFRLN